MKNSPQLELEIYELLYHQTDLDLAADQLLKKYADTPLAQDDLESISQFLISCGFTASLSEFLCKRIKESKILPWAHFAQALLSSDKYLHKDMKQALVDGADLSRNLSNLAKCHLLDEFESEMPQQRIKNRKRKEELEALKKKDLWENYELLKSQGLTAEEEIALKRYLVFFPGAQEALQSLKELKERVALDFVNKRTPQNQSKAIIFHYEQKSAEEIDFLNTSAQSMAEKISQTQDPELAIDFLINLISHDAPELALKLFENIAVQTLPLQWLKIEVQIKARHFVEALEDLLQIENAQTENPEAHFAIMYLRAQALWGLGQKYDAMEILENLLQIRPSYRSASALLDEWRENI